ncbi:putative mitochondrial carrier [Zancudomyces culisetae]|uniref:Putative mitochondrial carrier n=1 Tax=Zancudomyces culisetae TaxID=1213189 RepID=A0A1R1PXP7_ZANCU|nr:putative mitochondrial carrier [Zancudomyces culisetae]|eukprot:OMH85730.1 putative mitochondrial carrier [Zancudomyces culisetae]
MEATDKKKASSGGNQVALDLAAGWIGGIGQVLAGQPFDTIKVRLQTQSDMYKGPLDCLKKTVKNDGLLGLYKGTMSPLMGVGLCVSIQFFGLEAMKRRFYEQNRRKNKPDELSVSQLFIAGATAGVLNSVVSGPVEHIRVRMQVQTAAAEGESKYKGTLDCVRKIYSEHGLKGVYKGQVATMYREFFGYGVYFATYEYLVQRQIKQKGLSGRDKLSTLELSAFGSCAGYALWLLLKGQEVQLNHGMFEKLSAD